MIFHDRYVTPQLLTLNLGSIFASPQSFFHEAEIEHLARRNFLGNA